MTNNALKIGSQPLVSIVTPVYNEEVHLAECIESVLAQRYQHWEYAIIDNCSTDRSVEIALKAAAKDSRIRVVRNQQLLPAICNHNAAVRQVSPTSKYCKVVLGDDWMFPECLDRMVAVAERYPSAGIVGAYALENTDVAWTGLSYPESLIAGKEICRRHLLDKLYVFGTATSVLYRADLVRNRNPFYNAENIHADTEVCFALLKTCDFAFVHQVLTFTRVRPRSLSAISADLHTEFAGMLQVLLAYGRDYLTPKELNTCMTRHLSDYYRFLGKSTLRRRRDQQFWKYHERTLNSAGLGYSRTRVAKAVLAEVCNAALNPKQTFNILTASRRHQKVDDTEDMNSGQLFHVNGAP